MDRGVRLTHIGGPTTLIDVGGWRILTDPTFEFARAPEEVRSSVGWLPIGLAPGPA